MKKSTFQVEDARENGIGKRLILKFEIDCVKSTVKSKKEVDKAILDKNFLLGSLSHIQRGNENQKYNKLRKKKDDMVNSCDCEKADECTTTTTKS